MHRIDLVGTSNLRFVNRRIELQFNVYCFVKQSVCTIVIRIYLLGLQFVSSDTDGQRARITSVSTLIMKQQSRTSACADNGQRDVRPTPMFGASMRTRD